MVFRKAQTSNNTPQISLIKVMPESVILKQGEKVVFSAIGFDANDEPVSGVQMNWQSKDTGRDLPVRSLKNSTFVARATGTFLISAKNYGQEGQATVTVLPSDEGGATQQSLSSTSVRTISSRSGETASFEEKKPVRGDEKQNESKDQGTTYSQMSLPTQGYWNNGNWITADDPGNPTGSPVDDGSGNGNFQLSAPVVSLPGRGIDLSLNLIYNSRLWNKSGNELTYDIDRGFPAPVGRSVLGKCWTWGLMAEFLLIVG